MYQGGTPPGPRWSSQQPPARTTRGNPKHSARRQDRRALLGSQGGRDTLDMKHLLTLLRTPHRTDLAVRPVRGFALLWCGQPIRDSSPMSHGTQEGLPRVSSALAGLRNTCPRKTSDTNACLSLHLPKIEATFSLLLDLCIGTSQIIPSHCQGRINAFLNRSPGTCNLL